MPTKNGIGYSQHTPTKHDHYRMLLEIQIPIVGHILRRHTWAWNGYLHFDITAGNGGSPDEPGSPAIFKQVITAAALPYHAIFIEREPCNAETLQSVLSGNDHVTIECGDHAGVLPRYIQNCPVDFAAHKIYGSLFVDPTGSEPPWSLLRDFGATYNKIDIVIYLSATNIKRIRKSLDIQQDLLDSIRQIPKKHWLVREHCGRHQWTFLLGTNWADYPDWQAGGFYKMKSPAGERIIQELNYTNEERIALARRDQLELPLFPQDDPPYRTYAEYLKHPRYLAARRQALERSGGICEQCKERTVTEVHHIEYPAWGTFEKNADKLLAVCHVCHCEIHGKEN
jgi:hypothetical protein